MLNDCIKVKNINLLNKLDINDLSSYNVLSLAYHIFFTYHQNNVFLNNINIIYVIKENIYESISNILNINNQRIYLREHLLLLSVLGNIIEKATVDTYGYKLKGRIKYYSINYYFNNLIIDDKTYRIEFEVVRMDNGHLYYRLQNLKKGVF